MMKSILRPSSYTNWSYTNTNYALKQQQQQQQQQHEEDDDEGLFVSGPPAFDDKICDDEEIEEDNNNDDDDDDDSEEERSKVVRFTSPLVVEETTKSSSTIIIDGFAYDPSNADNDDSTSKNIGLYERKLTRAEKKQLAATKRAAKKAANKGKKTNLINEEKETKDSFCVNRRKATTKTNLK